MRRLWIDLKWWWHARRHGVADRTRFGAAEVVVPRWWDLRRWRAWSRSAVRQEICLPGIGGQLQFHRLRVVPAPRAPATPVTLKGGKTIVPAPVPREKLRRVPDPSYRGVSDAALEEAGVLVREEE